MMLIFSLMMLMMPRFIDAASMNTLSLRHLPLCRFIFPADVI